MKNRVPVNSEHCVYYYLCCCLRSAVGTCKPYGAGSTQELTVPPWTHDPGLGPRPWPCSSYLPVVLPVQTPLLLASCLHMAPCLHQYFDPQGVPTHHCCSPTPQVIEPWLVSTHTRFLPCFPVNGPAPNWIIQQIFHDPVTSTFLF